MMFVPFADNLAVLGAKSDIPEQGCLYMSGMLNLAFKLGHIGPKWDKSGNFKDQFQYILAQ